MGFILPGIIVGLLIGAPIIHSNNQASRIEDSVLHEDMPDGYELDESERCEILHDDEACEEMVRD